MRSGALLAVVFGVGCASHHEPPAPRRPGTSDGSRCTLRISHRGTFVDGEPMSRADAVNHCKRTAGAMVVVEDDVACGDWEPTCAALQREGVPIVMRGPVGDFRQPIVAGNAPRLEPTGRPRVRCHATCTVAEEPRW